MLNVFDEKLVNQLKANGLYDHSLAETQTEGPEVPIADFVSLKQVLPVNLFETNVSEDILSDESKRSPPFSIKHEQQNDKVIREIIFWDIGRLLTNLLTCSSPYENTGEDSTVQ